MSQHKQFANHLLDLCINLFAGQAEHYQHLVRL